MIDMPKACFHKYLNNHVEGLYLDLASTEWQTAVLLPTEDFVKDVQGHVFPYDKKDVWDEVDENYLRFYQSTKNYLWIWQQTIKGDE